MNVKTVLRSLALVAGLGAGLVVSAQRPGISLYGGVFSPSLPVNLEFYGPAGRATFRLERVLDPAAAFAAQPDPHRPVLPPGTQTRLVRTLTRTSREGYGRLELGRLPSGVYTVRASSGGSGASILLVVSRLALVVKRDTASALTYAADRESGATRPARLWLLERGVRGGGYADRDGLARFPVGEGASPVFLARYGEDWAISDGSFNSYARERVKGYLYTDRPVYRPGERVEYKGTLREADTLAPLAGARVRAIVRSPDGEEVARAVLTTNAYGSFSGQVTLGRGADVGSYRVVATLESSRLGPGQAPEEYGGSFEVETYVKPEYAVTVEAPARAVQGDRVRATVSAQYLFGGAAAGARVTYFVTKARYYPPYFEADPVFGETENDSGDYGADLVVREEARLDRNGRLELTLPLERDAEGRPASYRVQAEVEDESRRTVAGSTRVVAYPAAVNVAAAADSYVYDPGDPVIVRLTTTNLSDAGVAAPVTLDLVRQTWERGRNGYELRERVLESRTARTNARGEGAATFRAPQGGGYLVRARAKDAANRVSQDEAFVWVVEGNDTWYWNYRELELRLDKRTYAVGETVTALVGSPRPGAPVLVTLEAGSIRRAVVVRSPGAAVTYRFKVTPDMSPNVFLTATVLGGGSLYSQSARVRVPAPEQLLGVKLTPSKASYAPGEKGRLRVNVTDSRGRGVPAELGLGVVDEAIYLVRPDRTTDIRAFFHGPRENVVGTDSSLNFYFQSVNALAAPRPALSEAAFARQKESSESTVREDFRDTILWVPNLVTDARGEATVDLTFPDNLTTWRATARALTRGGRAGQATATTRTTKPLVARLSLPPHLVRGDTATLSAVVNNTTARPVSGTLSLELKGLTALGRLAGSLVVPAGGRTRTDLTVRADAIGPATITADARGGAVNDALRLPLAVRPRGFEATLGWASGAGDPPRSLDIPADARLDTARLRLYLAPSLAAAVTPALEYLVGYPYGCTEQTLSRFVPALLARSSLGQAALPPEVAAKLPEYVEVGLARLEAFQHEDGGWGFWEWDDSSLEMTAYVLGGLVKAKAQGASVKAEMLENGVRWLRAHARDPEATQAERAHAHRVLAEAARPDLAGMAALARRSELSPYSLAQLALASDRAGQARQARDLLDRLKAQRVERDRGVYWEKPSRPNDAYFYWDDNSIQVTAVALEALARLEPGSPLVPRVSAWLLAQRRGPRWVSTQDTAAVIGAALALGGSPAAGPLAPEVRLNGALLAQPEAAGAELELALPGLKSGRNTLAVSAAGAPGLVYSAELQYVREPARLGGDASRGLAVTRRYEKLVPAWDEEEERYTYARRSLKTGDRLEPVTVGDLVLVTLEVAPSSGPARYLAVSDPLPAGFGALDERSLAIAGLENGEDYDEWSYWYAGREIRDDRVDLYATYLDRREVMRYVMRAQTPGTFTALPTRAFLMYDPEVEGRAAAATLTVRDRGR